MKKQLFVLAALVMAASMFLAACGPAATTAAPATASCDCRSCDCRSCDRRSCDRRSCGPQQSRSAGSSVLVLVLIRPRSPLSRAWSMTSMLTQNAIHLGMEIIPNASARDTLSTEIAAGAGPDIVGPVGWIGSNAFGGQWLDIAPYLQSTNYDSQQVRSCPDEDVPDR